MKKYLDDLMNEISKGQTKTRKRDGGILDRDDRLAT